MAAIAGPRSEPPMPILTTFLMVWPVCPSQEPERSAVAKSRIRPKTSWTSAATSWPSTLKSSSTGIRSAVCNTARSSVLLMCSPANMASRRDSRSAALATSTSCLTTSPSIRFFDRSTCKPAASKVKLRARSASAAKSSRRLRSFLSSYAFASSLHWADAVISMMVGLSGN